VTFLELHLQLELMSSAGEGRFLSAETAALREYAALFAGYCLDTPDVLPSGGSMKVLGYPEIGLYWRD